MLRSDISIDFLNKGASNNMVGYLGIEYTEIGKDHICAKMPVDFRTRQPYGLLHGGASVVLAETLGSVGSNLCIDNDLFMSVGLEINANHVKSVSSGFVFGKATLLHFGKKTHIWDIRITNEADQLVCISRLTVAIIDKK
ncbi:MAG: hotdog fold thioesterase [Cytophagales bacterium]